MVQFSKLRLSGFKSFVDKTEMDIGPGLNGIVGPNGCGKSNLVEALRWVMGENSAKRMRGDGMEDVIFAGTSKRSPRNFAEVALLLDNSKRQAPSSYNNNDEIEVTRKIERDKGSAYRVNGKIVRARDVQMLFADTVTGANSPSLVSQGHVTRMINAKPQDRRLILEESAGIAGLYARRHEAELRLKAADANLLRLEDITSSMESRLNGLKRQARQASKYKNLSAQLRHIELLIAHLEWQALSDKKKKIQDDFNAAESAVAQNLITVTTLNKDYNTQFEALPELRNTETRLAAKLQKKKLELERASEEIKRYNQDKAQTQTQRQQANEDLEREIKNKQELEEFFKNTESEHATLLNLEEKEKEKLDAYINNQEEAEHAVNAAEAKYTTLKDSTTEQRAKTNSLEKEIKQSEVRLKTLEERKTIIKEKSDTLENQAPDNQELTTLQAQHDEHNHRIMKLKGQIDTVKDTIKKAEDYVEKVRNEKNISQKKLTEAQSEHATLEHFFQQNETSASKPVLEQIEIQSGYESALSRAMGDTLLASCDENAAERWTNKKTNHTLPKLSEGAQSLADIAQAPESLRHALSQIQIVDDPKTLHKLLEEIKPGQSIVTKDGEYWRWDGYHIQANATDRHAVYLQQKNKYSTLHKAIEIMEQEQDDMKKRFEKAVGQKQNAQTLLDSITEKVTNAENEINAISPQIQKHKEQAIRFESERKRLDQQYAEICEDIKAVEKELNRDKALHAQMLNSNEDEEKTDKTIAEAKAQLDQARSDYQNSIRSYDRHVQEQNTRRARIQAVADERINLKNRMIQNNQQIQKLKDRREDLDKKLEALNNVLRPQENPAAGDEQKRLEEIYALEQQKDTASENLSACEHIVSQTSKALKEAEAYLSTFREKRAAAHAMLTALNEQRETMERDIDEKFNLKPHALSQHIAIDLIDHSVTDLPNLRKQKETLSRERDMIGAVNLRAEEEMNELEKELTTLLHERNDLVQAIEELRGGISKINKEARERLLVAFDHVNAHFQELFVRLFSGGKAHLELVNAEDPLGAGLEIFAQPPGKSLQSLSLLSGGEQTLASIALIFAMFLTNPSPICVLDEIDAPLDDANVDKVCDLLEEISERVDTRFVIITHHRLSMARMDRLYGVTMSEKGVSQLISVDLQQSFGFIDNQAVA